MNLYKRLLAGLLAAAITAFSCAPAVYAEYEEDDTEITEDPEDQIPVLSMSKKSYTMHAGQKVFFPVEFSYKKTGKFGMIKIKASCASDEIIVDDTVKTVTSIEQYVTVNVEAPVSAAAGKYGIDIEAEIYDDDDEVISTQHFTVEMIVKSDLDITAVTIDSYKTSKSVIKPGDHFDLTVTLKNTSGADIKEAELELTGLDPTKFILDSGFSKQYVDIPNGRTGNVRFSLIAQSGIAYVRESIGLSLSYAIDKKKADTYREVSTTVLLTCEPDSASAQYGDHDLVMKDYSISSSAVKDGTKFELTLEMKNNSAVDISSARVSVNPDGSKFSLESGLGYSDFDIKAGQTKKITFRLIGGPGISSIRESIPVQIDFGSNSSTLYAAVTCAPAAEKQDESIGKYDLEVTGYNISVDTVAENTVFTLTVNVKNTGNKKIEKARLNVQNLDGTKFAIDKGLTYSVFDIAAGESRSISFDLIGCSGISSVREVIPIELEYGANNVPVYATVKCLPKEGTGSDDDGKTVFAPNIIIESYEFGGAYVTAGTQFPLSLVIKNVSSSAVIENLKVTISGSASAIDGSMAFSPANSSNSFFFEKLDTKQTETINIDLLAKSDAVPNSYPVEIAFSYEYSVGKQRFQANGNVETITIPLRQEDRLVVNEPEIPNWGVAVGEMITINTSLVNKGKSAVYNVTATVEGDGFSSETPSYYIGNINSGSEEYYDAKLTPFMDGDISGQLVFTYEDANGEAKEKRIPFTFTAMSFSYDEGNFGIDDGFGIDGGMDMMPEEQADYTWVWFVVGGGVILIAGVIVLIVVLHKRKKKAELEDDDEDN